MRLSFDEKKTTQLAAKLLKMRGTDEMYHVKLLKLLYLIDRESLIRWGRPVTYDKLVSMDYGPVLSSTFNLIKEEQRPEKESFWTQFIRPSSFYKVKLEKDPGDDELCDAEIKLAEEIFEKYGKMNRWKLIDDVMHKLPEWENPEGTSIPICYQDILRHNGKTPQEIAAIISELEYIQDTKDIFDKK